MPYKDNEEFANKIVRPKGWSEIFGNVDTRLIMLLIVIAIVIGLGLIGLSHTTGPLDWGYEILFGLTFFVGGFGLSFIFYLTSLASNVLSTRKGRNAMFYGTLAVFIIGIVLAILTGFVDLFQTSYLTVGLSSLAIGLGLFMLICRAMSGLDDTYEH